MDLTRCSYQPLEDKKIIEKTLDAARPDEIQLTARATSEKMGLSK
ncbi:MAG TPA: hypothetical protein VII93_09625 [Anaerolineales bacterium]